MATAQGVSAADARRGLGHRACCRLSLASILVVGYALSAGEGGGWIPLFDGSSLRGWRAAEHPESFRVADGAIACDGPRGHLFYQGEGAEADFKDFEFSTEVKTEPGANSGIYFHTAFQEQDWPSRGFEVQINNSQPRQGNYLELKKTGSLYGIRNVHKQLMRDGEWFTVRIRVDGKRVQVHLDDLQVVDYREADDLPRMEGEEGRRLGHGTFALQCHDPESRVMFRKLRVRILPEAERREAGPSPKVDAHYLRILELAGDNFPLINLHAHLKGGLTVGEVVQDWFRTGINYGIAVNCGVGFPITNDAGAMAFVESMRGQPVFLGMQAEGREWVGMFSAETRDRFDYVFTDAMTYTDHRGKRMRLWIPEEVEVGDPQVFLDDLVDRIVGILTTEPIDIYVNPTFLPAALMKDYDVLWTEGRMRRVIDAAAKRRIAIEINGGLRLPRERFIRMAKQAGIRFTFGTNNAGRDLGSLAYCLDMQQRCGLTWEDMFVPGSSPRPSQP